MDAEMKTACLKAAAKLAIGLSLVTALIGIRLVTATPDGVESGIEELERLDAELTSESSTPNGDGSGDPTAAGDSILSRLSAGVRDHLPSSDSRSRDGEKMVSCLLGGRTQFMRADDCSMRGGQSTVVSRDR